MNVIFSISNTLFITLIILLLLLLMSTSLRPRVSLSSRLTCSNPILNVPIRIVLIVDRQCKGNFLCMQKIIENDNYI